MWIIVYRKHGALMCETMNIGPFLSYGEAEEALSATPVLGQRLLGEINPGVRFIEELVSLADALEKLNG